MLHSIFWPLNSTAIGFVIPCPDPYTIGQVYISYAFVFTGTVWTLCFTEKELGKFMNFSRLSILLACLVLALFWRPALSEACENGGPVLSITVITQSPEAISEVNFKLTDLEDMAPVQFMTNTPWTEGVQEFTGIWMSQILDALNIRTGVVQMTAINDYSISLDVTEFKQGGALLAFKRNGELLSPRKKGPFWLVWNYDSDPAFRTESIYSNSIWQLDRVTISR